MPTSNAAPTLWHTEPVEHALDRLESTRSGLSDAEAAARLARYGANVLDTGPAVSALAVFAAQLRGVVVWLLVAAGATSVVFGDFAEAMAIAVVLAINTSIGFVTELRARRAMASLRALDAPVAIVLRDGTLRTLDAARVVPGDVVTLEAGHHVPADARVLEAHDLAVDEAALTGESLPVAKQSMPVPAATALADRSDMVYKGTTVMRGAGIALVTATGSDTELGRVGVLLGRIGEEPTPLERRLDELGRRLVWLTLGVAAVVAGLEAFHGAALRAVIETGIALAVAAVPEALPAVATISLAVGVHRMARRHALVRRLPAVEALGSATVVCTDKTRTLTSGRMALVRVAGSDYDDELSADRDPVLSSPARAALEAAVYASLPQVSEPGDGSRHITDPIDAAVLDAGRRAGLGREDLLTRQPLVAVIPFSSPRQFMASFHRDADGRLIAYVKGAPRQILERCSRTARGHALDAERRRAELAVNEGLARRGLRVLAVAWSPVGEPHETALHELRFAGFLGFMDPPARGVADTVRRLREAGLRTVMLTGDQRLTAEAVGRDLGLLESGAAIVSGAELDAMPPSEIAAGAGGISAYSRVSPEHKLTIVSALQSRGDIVAMLGDGINDAAALRKADVGVAMGGRGTDVAKEAAAIVLQDDRFETIAAAVEEGRIVFDNIRKFVFYLFSCNLAEVLVLFVAGVAGLPAPVVPLQLLWLNIVTDSFPALALAMEPGDPDVMRRPPRPPREAILSGAFLRSIAGHAAVITVSTLAVFVWTLRHDLDQARTAAFMTVSLAQVFHLGNARGGTLLLHSRARTNPYAVGAVAVACALQALAALAPALATPLRLAPLDLAQWTVVLGASLIPLAVGQALRAAREW